MTEPVFFKRGAGLTVGEIAALTGAVPRSGAALDRRVTGIAPIESGGPNDLIFCDKPKLAAAMATSEAGACLTLDALADDANRDMAVLCTPQPYQAFVTAAQALFPKALRPSSLAETSGIAGGAFVHPTARLEIGVIVDPTASVGPRAEIGARTVLGPGAVIGPDVRIGRDCSIGPHASVTYALVGDRVIIHSGCRVGTDGYGYIPGPKGVTKVPQVGRVIIQDDVEIGANSCIDRGTMADTVIGEGTKIDNLVQIGHNTIIGRNCILVGQVGISGSVTIEDYAMLAGQVGVVDHVTIGEGARIAAGSGVLTDVPPGVTCGGYPARPWRDFLRGMARMQRAAGRGGGPESSDEGRGSS